MDFANLLDKYIEILKITPKELSEASNISTSAISRYRNGQRIPKFNSTITENLIFGIAKIASEKNLENITKESIEKDFLETFEKMEKNTIDFEIIRTNFNTLVSNLNININKLSKSIDVDSSFIYRIISGERKPLNESKFINSICSYIIDNYTSEENIITISKFTNIDLNDIKNPNTYFTEFKKWFTSSNTEKSTINFLQNLDNFNLDEYIKAIHFNDLKVPTLPFSIKTSKSYYGLDEMKNGELDFFKSTIMSKNSKTLFIYNTMPMEDMAKDLEFGQKWMFAIAMCLKKGLHLNMIHNLNRPFNEILLGLESWIPIYMTGQISPYYIKEQENSIFSSTIYTSEVAALHGEGLKNYHQKSRYYLTSKKDELKFYQTQAELLLKSASPLMDIYTEKDKDKFIKFINTEKNNGSEIIEINNDDLRKTFKNITFSVCPDNWVLISKKTSPNINFVIHHPILRNSIENFVAPVTEEIIKS